MPRASSSSRPATTTTEVLRGGRSGRWLRRFRGADRTERSLLMACHLSAGGWIVLRTTHKTPRITNSRHSRFRFINTPSSPSRSLAFCIHFRNFMYAMESAFFFKEIRRKIDFTAKPPESIYIVCSVFSQNSSRGWWSLLSRLSIVRHPVRDAAVRVGCYCCGWFGGFRRSFLAREREMKRGSGGVCQRNRTAHSNPRQSTYEKVHTEIMVNERM